MQIEGKGKSTNLIQTVTEIVDRSSGTDECKNHPPKLNFSTAKIFAQMKW
jgi:hypothetical protein